MIPSGLSRETTIRRDASGRWFHEGDPVTNAAVARAFDRWIDVAEDGRFCLRNSVNWAYVEIEGAPLFVKSVAQEDGETVLHFSNDAREALRFETLRRDAEGRLYCTAQNGQLTALFLRRAMFELSDLIDEDEEGIFLWNGSSKVRPPVTDEPLKP